MNDSTPVAGQDNTPVTKRDLVEQKLDKVFPAPSMVAVSPTSGALVYQNMAETIEAAKMLAMSGPAVPPWLQGNPGGCWAVIIQANEWGLSPISVARMSYEVNGAIAYMSQLLHALIERRAPIKQRLRFTYEGDGETRRCICTGHIKGEVDPLVYQSPPLSKITPKKSPLWQTDPDQQLSYYSSRAWARRYCPDVLMGVYDRDEIDDHIGADHAVDVTGDAEALERRLAAAGDPLNPPAEGFREGVVDAGLNGELDHDPDTGEVIDGGSHWGDDAPAPGEPKDEPKSPAPSQPPPRGKKRTADAAPVAARGPKRGKRPATVAPAPKTALEPQPAGERTTTLTNPKHMPAPKAVKAAADRAEAKSPPPLPKTAKEYKAHVARWLLTYSTEQDIEARWRSEMKLRNTCQVTEEDRVPIAEMKNQRVQEVRR